MTLPARMPARALALLGLAAFPALADADLRIEAPLTETRGDGWRGVNIYMDEGGCTACHLNPDVAMATGGGDLGPEVGYLGEKYDDAQLRAILHDARTVFGEDTPMPAFGADGILDPQQIEDLIAYLRQLRH